MSDEFLEAIGMGDASYTIDLPNPYDLDGPWVNIGNFPTFEEAVEFLQNKFGSDANGMIELISIT